MYFFSSNIVYTFEHKYAVVFVIERQNKDEYIGKGRDRRHLFPALTSLRLSSRHEFC